MKAKFRLVHENYKKTGKHIWQCYVCKAKCIRLQHEPPENFICFGDKRENPIVFKLP